MAEIPADTPTMVEPPSNLSIHKIYVKDVSFESPSSPAIFNEAWQPQVEINVQNTGRKVGEAVFEVVLSVTVTAKIGEHVAFLIEVQQAGLFEFPGVSDDDARPLVGATCPGILYPYAREVVSDVITRGGFPALLLAPADFEAIYKQREADTQG
jgi:preprotein translocase subunit SecB